MPDFITLTPQKYTSTKQHELARLIKRFSGSDGDHETQISSLHLICDSNIAVPICHIQKPSLCIVAQGEKIVMLGSESYRYGVSDYLAVSVGVPITGRVTKASREFPYLAIRLDLDPNLIFDIMKETDLLPNKIKRSSRSLFLGKMPFNLLDAVVRLVQLLENPKDIPILAPLIIREILYRVLCDEQGDALKLIAMADSNFCRIAEVTEYIKKNYDKNLRIDDLAVIANMSSASLHRHFKDITAMSPLQYQKQIRLQEARRLLLSESFEAATVAYRVGYDSPSQFSREYLRMFGLPPISDIKQLRLALSHNT
ncbi:MAG TPA: AraC family transcriptional regulator [Methylomusa anaerophila]|uniref:HTH-type transcriptional activator RhaS n=1 Tax=Methylomusa anaerophila TaxID=1930071 RepID=A0A348AN83_9FIRM|nr:AraC family transcriptional regulator [Methylomusa anaerophila]BBB92531.1 HTH-type transcriptional activator RhaS [Methylomusa anaerophila]HML87615.1 AraC family transcriptional regulator [Methylomusa anaerophila]